MSENLGGHVPSRLAVDRRNDLFPKIEICWVAVKAITDAPRRVRRALKTQEAAVERAIERYGFRIPILVDGQHHVIDGHARLAAARLLGAEQVPCIVVDDLAEAEVRRLALSLNKLQEGGAWDGDALRLEISELIEIDGDIEIPGFEPPEIEAIRFGDLEPGAADPADDLSGHRDTDRPAVSREGDVWIVGDHCILCGSARAGDRIEALLAGTPVAAVFTDPPYNVKINGHVRGPAAGFEEFAEASGEMSKAEYTAFLTETLGHAAAPLKPGGILFVCIDWRHDRELDDALEALALEPINLCVWVKDAPGMGGRYRSQHELVCVVRKPGKAHVNNVRLGRYGRNRSNVWFYAGATGGARDIDDDFDAHPTVKPIRMVMDALLDVTAPGEIILDPFLGSGTTLLAAERTRRCCLGVEIAPRYVDLAIRRWQAMTGGTAVHAETGQTFDALAEIRDSDPSEGKTDNDEEAS